MVLKYICEQRNRNGDIQMERRQYPAIDPVGTGQMIKKIMQTEGFTVKDVQHYLGLDVPQSIYHWLEGKSVPSLDNLYALSELFRIPVDLMLKGNRQYVFVPIRNSTCTRLYIYSNKLTRMLVG